MPSPTPVLSLKSARELIRERSFASTTGDTVGVELEWFTQPTSDVDVLRALVEPIEPLPSGSTITFEPGGQLELSSAPLPSAALACDAIASDARIVHEHLATRGIGLFAAGSDPDRSLELRTDVPRYVAMRRFFDRFGPAAGRMMCGSASIHINVDGGIDPEGRERFEMARLLGPVLVAAFANSPIVDGRPAGWKSSRIAAWRQLDPTRTAPVTTPEAWMDYALGALVMFIRSGDDYRPTRANLTFGDWIDEGSEHGFPDADDLAYHLTTLFPPVRPHGHLELRMVDMVDEPWWRAAVGVATTLVCDPTARKRVRDACVPTRDMWDMAARCGLEDPDLHAAALACFDAAIEHVDAELRDTIIAFTDRFVRPGRCPADEQLDDYLVHDGPRAPREAQRKLTEAI
jgi:glutamate--cysteine ligase